MDKKESNPTILIALPQYGFDPTEVAIPWLYQKQANFNLVFATPSGKPAKADKRVLTGEGLGIFKKVLMADSYAIQAYAELEQSDEFNHPIAYPQIESGHYHGLLLPGGHDKGMKEYLESRLIHQLIATFFDDDKPVGAICHGTLAVARSISKQTGRSVLWGRKTTGLTKAQELISYYLTCIYLGDYYRTYPHTVEEEIKKSLEHATDFNHGPGFIIPLKKDHPQNIDAGFALRDNHYLSARWFGDAHKFAVEWVKLIKEVI